MRILILIFLSSCGYTKYGLNLEYTQNTYNEEIFYTGEMIGTKGSGAQFGISEELEYVITRINYFSTSYEDVIIDGTNVSLKESGLSYSIGFKLWKFQPRIVGGIYNSEAKTSTNTVKDKLSMLGFGLAFEQAIGDDHFLYVAYDILEASDAPFSEWQRLSLGYRFNFVTINGKK